jgi:autotransporter-associated beta strand protein
VEPLEDRCLLAVTLNWSGPGTALSLTENTAGATPAVIVSETSSTSNLLKVDLGTGNSFASGSTTSATGLSYQNAGSPATSQYATIDISAINNVSALQAALPGDKLTLGAIYDNVGGVGGIFASAGTIEAVAVATSTVNGNVDLKATGNLTVDSGAIIQTGTGTISLAADVNADGSGNDGAGTLSIDAGATVVSTNSTAGAITLRGAAINVDASSKAALVGAERSLNTTPTATLTGLNLSGLITPLTMACDGSGDLFVPNPGANTVSEFAPGSSTPSTTFTGLGKPTALALDASGNLFVANTGNNTVSEFASGNTTPTKTLTGTYLDEPDALALDASGNLYVANWLHSTSSGPMVNMFAPGTTTLSVFAPMGSGSVPPNDYCSGFGLAADGSGHLYGVDNDIGAGENGWVTVFPTPFTRTMSYSSFSHYDAFGNAWSPSALAFDPGGNFYVADPYWSSSGCVFKFAPGTTKPEATLTGLKKPLALAFDGSGNLYVANSGNNTVSEFAPGSTTPTGTLTGLNGPEALTLDNRGDLFVANKGNNTVSEFNNATPVAGGVVIRSSLPSRPISLGGDSDVAGINLTQAELAQIQTTSTGTVTFGDSTQTGTITATTATLASTAGEAAAIVQSSSGAGQIVLNSAGSVAGLNGNGGTVTLTPGTGGIVAPISATAAALVSQGFSATGLALTPTLSFVPTPGSQFTIINNTATPAAANPIAGTFANLPPGGTISASFGGTSYFFTANYAGGDGNDLVLTALPGTSTVLAAAPSSSVYGQSVTFTATVTSGGSPVSGGTVDFDEGSNVLASAVPVGANGLASFSIATLSAAGSPHAISAFYSGTSQYAASSGSASLTVTPEVVSVTSVQTLDNLEASGNVQYVIGSGGDLTVNNPISLDAGGTVSVQSGRVTVPGINSQPGATGLDLDSGTLCAAADFTTTAPVTIRSGGATIDTNGYDVSLDGALAGCGGLTKTGDGALTLSMAGNCTGGTTISGGEIISNDSAALPSGNLELSGGNLVLSFGGQPSVAVPATSAVAAAAASVAQEPATTAPLVPTSLSAPPAAPASVKAAGAVNVPAARNRITPAVGRIANPSYENAAPNDDLSWRGNKAAQTSAPLGALPAAALGGGDKAASRSVATSSAAVKLASAHDAAIQSLELEAAETPGQWWAILPWQRRHGQTKKSVLLPATKDEVLTSLW